jgi:hypothetical protein
MIWTADELKESNADRYSADFAPVGGWWGPRRGWQHGGEASQCIGSNSIGFRLFEQCFGKVARLVRIDDTDRKSSSSEEAYFFPVLKGSIISPKQKNYESTYRQDCLNQHWFRSIVEAQTIIEAWRQDYNANHPHSALGYVAPDVFARQWRAAEEGAGWKNWGRGSVAFWTGRANVRNGTGIGSRSLTKCPDSLGKSNLTLWTGFNLPRCPRDNSPA